MLKRWFITFFVATVLAWGITHDATAFDLRCDPGVLNELTERARVQSWREEVNAENLIYKPDSVLEYSCFPRFGYHIISMDPTTADVAMGIYNVRYASGMVPSGLTGYIGVPESGSGPTMYERGILYPSVLQHPYYGIDKWYSLRYPLPAIDGIPYGSFKTLMVKPATEFLYGNFGHTFMGGRQNNQPSMLSMIPGLQDYICDAMEVAWNIAKCESFAPRDEDGFYDIAGFVGAVTGIPLGPDGIRRYPQKCLISPMTLLIDTGNFPTTPVSSSITGTAAAIDCGKKIPTGKQVTAVRNTDEPAGRPATYNEKICSNPICTYTPTSAADGTCTPPP